MKRKIKLLVSALFILLFIMISATALANPYPSSQTFEYNGDMYTTVPCTYAAWQIVYDRFNISLPSWGNGGQWLANAQSDGWSTGSTPKANSLAVYNGVTDWGHVAFVESVENGTMTLTEGGIPGYGFNTRTKSGWSTTVGTQKYSGGDYLRGFIYISGGDTNHDPEGALDPSTAGGKGTVRVYGWAYDKDALNKALSVHIYVGAPSSANNTTPTHIVTANKYRSDLDDGGNYTGYYGFDETFSVPASLTGKQTVYAYAINEPAGNNPLIGTREVTIQSPEMTQGYDRVIPDGDYIIAACANPLYYLDIEGTANPAGNNNNVQINKVSSLDNISAYDVWTVTYNSSTKFYTIKQKGTTMCLDVQGDGTGEGTNVQVYSSNGQYANPKTFNWAISKKDSKGYRLQSRSAGLSLDMSTGLASGVNVRQWKNTSSDDEGWLFIPYKPSQPINNGDYVILYTKTNAHEIDLEGDTGDLPNNKKIQIWKDTANSRYNTYTFTKLSNGYYKIKHVESGKCLDVKSSSTTYNAAVGIYDDNGSLAQQWAIIKDGAGYNIISRCNGYALDLPDGVTTNGTFITSYPKSFLDYQRWSFVQAKHTVSFNLNGGTGNITSQNKYYKTPMWITSTTPTKTDYKFAGWGTSANATTAAYQPGGQFTTDADTTLYAVWKESIPPEVTGGSITNVSATSVTFTVTAMDNTGVDHVDIHSWCNDWDSNDNHHVYQAIKSGDSWSYNVPLDLANGKQWWIDARVYDAAGNQALNSDGGTCISALLYYEDLTFDLNGGTCQETSKQVILARLNYGPASYVSTYGDLPSPILQGHLFDGWWTEETGGNLITSDSLVTNESGHTLYAKWKEFTRIQLPAAIKTIDEQAFESVNTNVFIIPATVTSIGKKAFANNDDLYEVYVYSTTVTPASDAFLNCPNLTIYGYSDTPIHYYAVAKKIHFESLGASAN